MADADEDDLAAVAANEGAEDLTDEPQDFRFLSSLSLDNEYDGQTLPRRGLKDFEPHQGLSSQEAALRSARAAMHNALSYPRIHHPKHHVIGVYHPDTGRVRVALPKGQNFTSLGVASRDGVWLFPEEALFLLEGGRLDVRWPAETERRSGSEDRREENEEGSGEQEGLGLPMSLQGAYAAFIGMEAERTGWKALTLEKFNVYAGLKRLGYVVRRAYDWESEEDDSRLSEQQRLAAPTKQSEDGSPSKKPFGLWHMFSRMLQAIWQRPKDASAVRQPLPFGPLVRPGLYRSYNDVFLLLQIIPSTNPALSSRRLSQPALENHSPQGVNGTLFAPPTRPVLPYRVTYHVWKPTLQFRKTAPPPPDYYICVINAREQAVPTLSEISSLIASVPYDPPLAADAGSGGGIGQVYKRLKYGYRNVILAVVDQGVVSYTEVVDPGFSQEKLYELRPARGGKGGRRGGRGGRRGRGRGRGGAGVR